MTVTTNERKGSDRVRVFLRIRPCERESVRKNIISAAREHVTTIHPTGLKPNKTFNFDRCFSTEINENSQEEIFSEIGTPLVENAFNGYNGSIIAYGQTGSGKTFTMMGAPEQPGLIPRLCLAFQQKMLSESNESTNFRMDVSYFEIYNERVFDLLATSRQHHLKVREHKMHGPMVEGLNSIQIRHPDEILRLINEGNKLRSTAETKMNLESSRSHAIFSIKLTQVIVDPDDNTFTGEKVSKISLVDLAGSEKARKTGATGKRLEEGSSINKSLTTLGIIIEKLAEPLVKKNDKKKHGEFIPYRDSTLTWLLKENLGGNSRTAIVATVSSVIENYEETLSTLRFAHRASSIVNVAVVNEDPNAKIIRELREEVDRLRLRISQSQEFQKEELLENLTRRHQEEKQAALEKQYEQFERYIQELTQTLQTPSTLLTPSVDQNSKTESLSILRNQFPRQINSPSPFSSAMNEQRVNTGKTKFFEWLQQRNQRFKESLQSLRIEILAANVTTANANKLSSCLSKQRGCSFTRYEVSLQIPVENLRPGKLRFGESICQVTIRVSDEFGSHLISPKQLEEKLEEMRQFVLDEELDTNISNFQLFHDDLYLTSNCSFQKREKQCLIGVANVFLGSIFYNIRANHQVLIINQQGEIAGKLDVEIEVYRPFPAAEISPFTPSIGDGLASHNQHFIGQTIRCRIKIKEAMNLPVTLLNLVFCQYSFFNGSPIVIAPIESGKNQSTRTSNVIFDAENDFDISVTHEFLEYVEEDALSIEIWGHQSSGDNSDDFDEVQAISEGSKATEVALKKRLSLQERWSEVTKRVKLFVELMELNDTGEYTNVQVDDNQHVHTGGIYRLKPGQQRRIKVSIQDSEHSGSLPFRIVDFVSVSVGSIISSSDISDHTRPLDSYHEEDLERIRDHWNLELSKRQYYLQNEILLLSNKKQKTHLDSKREQSLMLAWVELMEERNAISVPCAGIPGAPANFDPLPAMEKHIPLIFLQADELDDELDDEEYLNLDNPLKTLAGIYNLLDLESFEDFKSSITLPVLEKNFSDLTASCICSWDSSLHQLPTLNSSSSELIYAIVNVMLRLSFPFPMSIVLRKRICINIGGKIWPRWPRWQRENQAGTGLLCDIVACIPKSTTDVENKEMLALMAVRDAKSLKETNDSESSSLSWNFFASPNPSLTESVPEDTNLFYLTNYIRSIQAIEWLIKMDRLRQEDTVNSLLLKQKHQTVMDSQSPMINSGMKRTISLPNAVNSFYLTSRTRKKPVFEEWLARPTPNNNPSANQPIYHKRTALPPLPPGCSEKRKFPGRIPSSESFTLGSDVNRSSLIMSSVDESGYQSMVSSIIPRLNGIDEEQNLQRQILPDEIMNENECKFLSVDDTQSSQNCNDNLGISSNIDRLYINDGNNLQHELSNGNRKKSSNNDECFVENRMFSNTNAYDYEYDRSSKCFHRQKNYFSNTIVSRKLMSAAVTDDNHSDGRNSSASNDLIPPLATFVASEILNKTKKWNKEQAS